MISSKVNANKTLNKLSKFKGSIKYVSYKINSLNQIIKAQDLIKMIKKYKKIRINKKITQKFSKKI